MCQNRSAVLVWYGLNGSYFLSGLRGAATKRSPRPPKDNFLRPSIQDAACGRVEGARGPGVKADAAEGQG